MIMHKHERIDMQQSVRESLPPSFRDDDVCESGRKRFVELCLSVLHCNKRIHFAHSNTF